MAILLNRTVYKLHLFFRPLLGKLFNDADEICIAFHTTPYMPLGLEAEAECGMDVIRYGSQNFSICLPLFTMNPAGFKQLLFCFIAARIAVEHKTWSRRPNEFCDL